MFVLDILFTDSYDNLLKDNFLTLAEQFLYKIQVISLNFCMYS